MTVSVDKGKLIDQAVMFVLKGQIDKAIGEYQKVVEADPKDSRIRLKLADLYLKKGNKPAAVEEYFKAADNYSHDDFNLQAIAVYKQLQRIDPSIIEIYLRLADLYRKQGLIADALSQYRIIITNYEKLGKSNDVIDVLKQMVSIDPSNVNVRVKLAEMIYKSGTKDEAIEEFNRIAMDLNEKGKLDEIIKLYDRLLGIDPGCVTALREIGAIYLKTGQDSEALANLKHAVKFDPNDIKSLNILAEIYIKTGDYRNAKLTYEHILKVHPEAIKALKGIARVYMLDGNAISAIDTVRSTVDKALEQNRADDALTILLEFYRYEVREPYILERMSLAYLRKGETQKVAELNAELADVYETLGNSEKARALRAEKKPEGDVFDENLTEEMPPVEASEEIQEVQESLAEEGIPDTETEELQEHPSEEVFSEIEAGTEYIEELGSDVEVSFEEAAPDAGEISNEIPAEEHAMESTQEAPAAELLAGEWAGAQTEVMADLEEAEFYLRQGLYDESRAVCKSILESTPDNKQASDLLDSIHEAEQQQFSGVTKEEPGSAADDFFDLAAELEAENIESLSVPPGLSDSERFGFEDIFSAFKKGVDSHLPPEDTDTHYNLGIAYKEMGLFEDAIREFQIASTDPEKRFDSYNLIGICLMETSNPRKAAEIFAKALQISARSDNEYANMNYELGRAYEKCGMKTEALAAYKNASKLSPGFRDVDARLSELGPKREVKKGRVSFI